MYEYRARLVRILNGNTIEADIDLGFDIQIRQQIRLFGIAAESLQSNSKEKFLEEKNLLISVLPENFIIHTILNKRGRRGRILGILYKEQPSFNLININEELIKKGATKIND